MEYAIMVPILLVQVILIPAAASWIVHNWILRRRETALQDVGSRMGSTIQQLYFALNRDEIAAGITTQATNVPPFIESTPYLIIGSSRRIGNSTIIDLQLDLVGLGVGVTTFATLGPNALFQDSTFVSNSTIASIAVEKYSNGTLSFSFTS